MATSPDRSVPLSTAPAHRSAVMVARHAVHGSQTGTIVKTLLSPLLSNSNDNGSNDNWVRNADVLLKPALRHGRFFDPRYRLTTHPAILEAAVESLRDFGANVRVGMADISLTKELAWLFDLAKKHDIPLVDFAGEGFGKFTAATGKSTPYLVSRSVMQAEHVINLSNLQMHRRLRLAAGLKNLANVVSSRQQAELFSSHAHIRKFADSVVDIFEIVKPSLTLLDLTTVRINQITDEDPIFVAPNCLVASTDTVAAAATACRIVGFNPEELRVLKRAARRGLGTLAEDAIESLGESCNMAAADIKTPRAAENPKPKLVSRLLGPAIDTILPKQLVVSRNQCVRCSKCESVCPADALHMDSVGVAEVDNAACIRCGLCIDECEHGALGINRTFLRRPLGPSEVSTNESHGAVSDESEPVAKPNYLWEKMKKGVTVGVGPVKFQLRAQRKTCSNPHRVKITAPTTQASQIRSDSVSDDNKETEKSSDQLAVLVGAGPKLGRSLALRFAREGFNIALCARKIDALTPLVDEITALGVTVLAFQADATNSASVEKLFEQVGANMGVPNVVVYNVVNYSPGTILTIPEAAFKQAWESSCLGGFLVGQQAARAMSAHGRGTIIYTGATASMRGRDGYINMTVGKAGLRAMAQSMSKELGPLGIHVAHVVLDGGMMAMNPDAVAENYWNLHKQPKSAWSFEIDLRSNDERW